MNIVFLCPKSIKRVNFILQFLAFGCSLRTETVAYIKISIDKILFQTLMLANTVILVIK